MIYFTAHTFKCVCHCRRGMFRVLGMYNFGTDMNTYLILCMIFFIKPLTPLLKLLTRNLYYLPIISCCLLKVMKRLLFVPFFKKPEIKVQLEQHMFFATWLSLFHISVWWNALTTDSSWQNVCCRKYSKL